MPLLGAEYLGNGTRQTHSYNEILMEIYTRPTQGYHFQWLWVTSNYLVKYSVTRNIARSLCDRWAPCLYGNWSSNQVHRWAQPGHRFYSRGTGPVAPPAVVTITVAKMTEFGVTISLRYFIYAYGQNNFFASCRAFTLALLRYCLSPLCLAVSDLIFLYFILYFYILYFVFYSLYLILVQLTLLCLVVYGSTVSAPCCLVVLFHSKCFYVILSYLTALCEWNK